MSENNNIAAENKLTSESANAAAKTSQNCDYRKVFIVMLLPSLLALLLAIYALYDTRQSRTLTENNWQTVNTSLSQTNQQLAAQKDWQTNYQTSLDKQQQQLDKVNSTLQTALQQPLYQKQDWLLYKARYYLELAQINAHWSENQQTTIALLHEADFILQGITDQSIFVVRQSIAEEISQLNALPTVDIAGILSQLDSARQEVNELPLKGNIDLAQPDSEPSTTNAGWRDDLHNSIGFLKKLIVVRHQETDIQPLLSPMHQALIRESLRLDLQQAQWAALQHNEAIFQQMLNQALEDITRNFDSQAISTQAIIEQLKTLQKLPLKQKSPTIEQSLQQLNDLIGKNNTSTSSDTTGGK